MSAAAPRRPTTEIPWRSAPVQSSCLSPPPPLCPSRRRLRVAEGGVAVAAVGAIGVVTVVVETVTVGVGVGVGAIVVVVAELLAARVRVAAGCL